MSPKRLRPRHCRPLPRRRPSRCPHRQRAGGKRRGADRPRNQGGAEVVRLDRFRKKYRLTRNGRARPNCRYRRAHEEAARHSVPQNGCAHGQDRSLEDCPPRQPHRDRQLRSDRGARRSLLGRADRSARAQNFRIGNERMPIALVHALGIVKRAAAETNRELGLLDAAPRRRHRPRRARGDRRQARRSFPAGGLADRLRHPDQHERSTR